MLAFLWGSQITELVIWDYFHAGRDAAWIWPILSELPLTSLRLEQHAGRDAAWIWPILSELPLTSLGLEQHVGSLQGLREALPNLRKLSCRASTDADLTCLRGLKLTHLSFGSCVSLTSLDGIEEMPLTHLELHDAHKLQTLDGLAGLPLTRLTLGKAYELKSLEEIIGLPLTYLALLGVSRSQLYYVPTFGRTAKQESRSVLELLPDTVEHIDLEDGHIYDDELLSLKWRRLKTLNLRSCRDITPIGIAHLSRMPSPPLRLLDLRSAGEHWRPGGLKLFHCPEHLRPVIRVYGGGGKGGGRWKRQRDCERWGVLACARY
jgi:hypothetical protein